MDNTSMNKKTLLLLGGIRYLLPVITAAHREGYYVITADYLPDNIAHKYSDEYVNVSIVDKEAVLKVAREHKIDGIMSFGVDPGVVTAAYVAEQMGLPSVGPYSSVDILQHKDKFRAFLTENGFNVPWSYGFGSVEEAWKNRASIQYPAMVKPTDSAGSKGCSKVDDESELHGALVNASKFSLCGRIVVEEYLQAKGFSSDSDCYSRDGKLEFVSFNSQRFDAQAWNPFTPAGYLLPSSFSEEEEKYLTSEIQRLIGLLGMGTAVYNVETRVCENGKPYIMELSPRGGGNRLCEMLRYATGVDLISAMTRAAVGDDPGVVVQKGYEGHWAEVIVHSDNPGVFEALKISEDIPAEVVETDLWVKPGDYVNGFNGANDSIGTIVLRFVDNAGMEQVMADLSSWIRVEIVS